MKEIGKTISYKALLLVVLVGCALLAFRYNQQHQLLTLSNFQLYSETIQDIIHEHYFIAVLLFWVIYVVVVNTAIPALTLLNLVGGYFFGVVMGSIYCTVDLICGATIQFLLSRYLISDWVRTRYQSYFEKAKAALNTHQTTYLLTLRIIPGVPFVASNLILGITNLKLWPFIWTATLGMVGKIIIYSYAGQSLSEITHIRQIISPTFLRFYIGYMVLIMGPALIIAYRTKKNI